MDNGKVVLQVEVDAELAARAKEARLDVSETVERALRTALNVRRGEHGDREERARRWREDNAEAIRISNEELERNGLWSDGYRRFS